MLFILTSIGFFLWSIRMILFWTSLWQVKEYRLDRLFVHVKETIQGRWILFSPFLIANVVLILLYGLVIVSESFNSMFQFVVFVYFIIEGLYFIREIIRAQFKRPARTVKAMIICFLTLCLIVFAYAFSLVDKFLSLLLLQFFIPLFVGVFVFTFSFPTELYKDYLVQKAKGKLLRRKDLLVIGISGSYGKSSTKEYVAHILSRKFSVVKTPLSNNTPIAVAKTVLNKVTEATQILIIEMGSYKRGEVAELCDIVMPQISITTALGEQHISLYGSLDNILHTEKELIHALPPHGIALFNANSPYMERLYNATRKQKILYGTQGIEHKKSLTVVGSDIVIEKNGLSFQVKMKKQRFHFHTQLLGKHNVENILPGIYLADHLGMSTKEITKAVESLVPLQKTMKKFTTQGGVILIDDTFNASPESVIAAASYMKVYTHKKFFVLMPLIELGTKAKEYHYSIGQELANFDYLFLTNKNFVKDIQRGIISKKGKCFVKVTNPDTIAEDISSLAKKGDVILFEGKESGIVLNKLL